MAYLPLVGLGETPKSPTMRAALIDHSWSTSRLKFGELHDPAFPNDHFLAKDGKEKYTNPKVHCPQSQAVA